MQRLILVLVLVTSIMVVSGGMVSAAVAVTPAETLFVSVGSFPGGVPGNDATGDGSRLAPYREINYTTQFLFARNAHVIFVGPSRDTSYNASISTPYDRLLKIVSEKGPDSTYLTSADGYGGVSLNADTVLQVFEGFTIANVVASSSCEGACEGGIYAFGHAWVVNNKILRNVGSSGGGGIDYWGTPGYAGIIAGNWIAGNSTLTGDLAGGIQADHTTALTIINNTIVANVSLQSAGIYIGPSATGVTIANNIIAYNHSGYGIYNISPPGSPVVVSHNLFYQNTAGDAFGLPPFDASNIVGAGANPLLVDWSNGDYHQTCSSPGRETGSNGLIPAVLSASGDFAWDIDGPPQARIDQTNIDMGGDEFWDARKVAAFTAAPRVGCDSLTVSFTNTSSCIDEQWLWNFGDGGTSVSKNPVHIYSAPGRYTVRLIAKGLLNSDTLTRGTYIRVAAPPAVSFGVDNDAACDSLRATFVAAASSDVDSLRWTFGDGGTGFGSPISHLYTKSGSFTVSVRAYNPCGDTSSTRPGYITIGARPQISIAASSDSLISHWCIPVTVRLHTVTDLPLHNWLWDFGDGDTTGSRLANPAHKYTKAGTFTVRLIADGDCGSDTALRADYLQTQTRPTATIDAIPKTVCKIGQTVQFAATYVGAVDSSRWLFDDGKFAAGPNAGHIYSGPGIYHPRIILFNACSVDTLPLNSAVTVWTLMEIGFRADVVKGCDSLTATFTATTNPRADSLSWNFGDGGTALGNPVTHTYTTIGRFDVGVRGYNPCGDTLSLRPGYVTIGQKPSVSITSSYDSAAAPLCTPFSVRFHAVSNQTLTSWNWDYGDGDTTGSTLANPSHLYTQSGTYSVHLFASGDCTGDTAVRPDYIRIPARPAATMDATPRSACTAGQKIDFSAVYNGAVDSSRWLFGDGSGAPGPDVSHGYPETGVYQSRVVLFHACGVDTLALNSPIDVGSGPQAALFGTPRTGFEPLATQFSDSSLFGPASWLWNFGDGSISADQNPVHTYAAGIWNVKLTSTNACGTSGDSIPQYVRVIGFLPSFDSSGVRGDSILYSLLVDSVVSHYDRAVALTGTLLPPPRRGSAGFHFDVSTGTPRFATTLKVVPSGDLASGDYTIRLSAIDPRVTKSADRTWHHAGPQFIDASPDTILFGRVGIGGATLKKVLVRNLAAAASGYNLHFTVSDSGSSFTSSVTTGLIQAQESTYVLITFAPAQFGELSGTASIDSDDPANPHYRIVLRGRGVFDAVPPQVSATSPSQALGEVPIDSAVRFTFNKPVLAVNADSLVIVADRKFSKPIAGHLSFSSGSSSQPFTWVSFAPAFCGWFPPDDTLTFRIRAVITDTAGNGLDGNTNGIDEGSPVDDYVFSVSTGPGVLPGDADQDQHVDERDILPIARYWGLTGPPRQNICNGFVEQPATSWNPRAATSADADGNGVVDSADICPIAQYFDRSYALPKATVESWMNEARSWDRNIMRSLSNALANCPDAGRGQAVLKRFLDDLLSGPMVPATVSLGQNYPNPFNPTTVIEYSLTSPSNVRLEILDITGRLVTVLEDGEQQAGQYTKIWDGTDAEGRSLASGIYFYRLVTPEFHMARKMVLIK